MSSTSAKHSSLSLEIKGDVSDAPSQRSRLLLGLAVAPSALLALCAIADLLGVFDAATPAQAYAVPSQTRPMVASPGVRTHPLKPSLRGHNAVNYPATNPWGERAEPVPQDTTTVPAQRPDLKTLMDPKIDPRVVQAVDHLKGKVTVADVASAAGVDLHTATTNVRDMAYLTGAAILVSETGELLYDFGRAPSARLASASARAAVSQTWQKVLPPRSKGLLEGEGGSGGTYTAAAKRLQGTVHAVRGRLLAV